MFAIWGRIVYRRRWLTLLFSGLVLTASLAVLMQGGTLGKDHSGTTESDRAARLIAQELPSNPGFSITLVFGGRSLAATDPRFRTAMLDALAPLRTDPRVTSIRTPFDTPETNTTLIGRDGTHALAFVSALKDYPAVRALVHSDTLDINATGATAINHDFDTTLQADLQRAELVSLPLTLLLLLLVFGTFVAALLPLGVGVLAVMGGLSGVFLLSRATNVSQYALNIVTLIGLGVAIDYSLFIVNRFREELERGATTEEALAQTLATTGRAIAFSGLTVAVGLSGLLFYRGTFLASMGMAGAIVVGFAVLYGLTFLPALLALLGPRINRGRLPFLRPATRSRLWHRIATGVMRRPILVLVPTLVLILAIGAPFLRLRLANGDITMLPTGSESRQGYDLLQSQFPHEDRSQFAVAVQYPGGSPLTPDRVGALYDFSQRLGAIPGVLRVESIVNLDPSLGRAAYQQLYAPGGSPPAPAQAAITRTVGPHIVTLTVYSALPASSDAARGIVDQIRAQRSVADGQALVSGITANDIDTIAQIRADTPAALLFVMIATYLVLFLLLGSVIVPLKAVLMNLLSITASFGALVWVFQQGHLSGLLHFTPASLDPSVPVLLFCIVFGLSMDYEVLLLSRIQEEYRRTGDNTAAVASGLERSGRLITGAAAIMVGVFSAFGLADVVIIKSIGLGMALAVALDATVVRALIVPATMRLLGHWNWWAPRPLARVYHRLRLSESAAPVQAVAPVMLDD
ncbi:MAG: MMPL family transporter [Thermomicrobia bacterium]|nr:MMPL family transporter [Thermomicrobia bacterium]